MVQALISMPAPALPIEHSPLFPGAARFELSSLVAPVRRDVAPGAQAARAVVDRAGNAGADSVADAFAAMVAHELRSQLRLADALRGRMAEVLGDADAVADYLARLAACHQRMEATLADLLALGRAGNAPLACESVDLSALAWSIVADLEAVDPGARTEWVIEPAMATSGDPALLRLLLANLFGNAFKYARRTPSPRVQFFRTAGRGGRAEYHVCDNGIGLDAAEAASLFAPFHRLPGASGFAGTGLGLAIVRRIALRHGGGVRAAGARDCGARFTFWL